MVTGKPLEDQIPGTMQDRQDLTEVRVRGKRYRKKPASSGSEPSTALTGITPSPKQSKPPSNTPEDLRKRRGRHAVASSTDVRGLSSLENLPTELLEIIFLGCLNVSLPRASLSIGKRLASTHIKSELFAIAFSKIQGNNLKEVPLEAEDRLRETFCTHTAVARFQTSILTCRWMTPAFLRYAMGQLLIEKSAAAINRTNVGWIVLNQPNQDDTTRIPMKALSAAVAKLYEVAHSSYDKRWSVITSQEWTWSDVSRQQDVRLVFRIHQGFPHSMSIHECRTGPVVTGVVISSSELLYTLPKTRLPQRFLCGPWDAAKCTMLAQLSKAHCRIDQTAATTDEEVAEQGLRYAIIQPSIRAIVTLVGSLRHYSAGCTLAGCDQCEQPGRNCMGTVYQCSLCLTVTTEDLKLAIAADSPLQVFECLLDALNLSIQWSDEYILAWAVEKREQRDARGQFLFDRYADSLKVGDKPRAAYDRRKRRMSPKWINSEPSWLHDEDNSEA